VLLLCTDGLWANCAIQDFVRLRRPCQAISRTLTDLGTQAVEASAPYSDNTSAAAAALAGRVSIRPAPRT